MAVNAAGLKFPAVVDLPHTSVPSHPVLCLLLLPNWAGRWPCFAAALFIGFTINCFHEVDS